MATPCPCSRAGHLSPDLVTPRLKSPPGPCPNSPLCLTPWAPEHSCSLLCGPLSCSDQGYDPDPLCPHQLQPGQGSRARGTRPLPATAGPQARPPAAPEDPKWCCPRSPLSCLHAAKQQGSSLLCTNPLPSKWPSVSIRHQPLLPRDWAAGCLTLPGPLGALCPLPRVPLPSVGTAAPICPFPSLFPQASSPLTPAHAPTWLCPGPRTVPGPRQAGDSGGSLPSCTALHGSTWGPGPCSAHGRLVARGSAAQRSGRGKTGPPHVPRPRGPGQAPLILEAVGSC